MASPKHGSFTISIEMACKTISVRSKLVQVVLHVSNSASTRMCVQDKAKAPKAAGDHVLVLSLETLHKQFAFFLQTAKIPSVSLLIAALQEMPGTALSHVLQELPDVSVQD